MNRLLLPAAGLLLALALLLSPSRTARADGNGPNDASVSIVHGVPGLTVDVYVNGGLFLEDFLPGTITEPQDLAPGTYDIAIVAANGDPSDPAIEGSATVSGGVSYSLVAHLAADGTPSLTPFVNDLDRAGRRGTRLAVRHTAAAPAVDVPLGIRFGPFTFHLGTIAGLENGEQAEATLWRGRYVAAVTLADQPNAVVLGPAELRLRARTYTAVYAIGSAADGTLDLLVQSLDLERRDRHRDRDEDRDDD